MATKTSKKTTSRKKQSAYKTPGKKVFIAIFALLFAAIGSYFVLLSKAASPTLAWAPPGLTNPITVTLSSSNKNAKLDPAKDYIIKLSGKITGVGSVNISGGHNVVLIGGEINHTETGGPANDPGKDQLGLTLKNWTGTMHVEGLYISGTTLGEGIDVDTRTPGAILQLQNIRVDTVKGSQATNHADIVQNWGGPTVYRIDRLTGSTNYQGFMVQPLQFDSAMTTKEMDFRNINVTGANTGYKFFRASGVEKLTFTNVYFQPSSPNPKVGYPESDPVFKQIHIGLAPTDFVASGIAGVSYASPGYGNMPPPTTPTTPTPTPVTPPPTTPVTPPPTTPTTPTPTPVTPPVITSPKSPPTAPGLPPAPVTGTVTIQQPAVPNAVKTEVYVDNKLKTTVSDATTASINTAQLSNGSHTVTVKTTDAAGNTTQSSTTMDVSNSLMTQVLGQATTTTGKTAIGTFIALVVMSGLFIFKVIKLPSLHPLSNRY